MRRTLVPTTTDEDPRRAAQIQQYDEEIIAISVVGADGAGGGGGGGGTSLAIGATPPSSPQPGWLWWRTTDGVLYVYYDDGTSQQWVPATPEGGIPRYYLLAGAYAGIPTPSMLVASWVAVLPFTLPVGLAGSQANAHLAATASTSFIVAVNGTTQGTIQWAAGATVATFSWTNPIAINIGDRVDVNAPTTPDATLTDPTWTLRGML